MHALCQQRRSAVGRSQWLLQTYDFEVINAAGIAMDGAIVLKELAHREEKVLHIWRCALRIRPPNGPDYISRRPSIAFSIVISSVYSMSLPTGIPMAMRVTFTPARLSCCDR